VPSRPSILYVEDDASIAEMYSLGLGRAGFDLTVAGDWPSGRRLLRKRSFDVVLLDVMLPGPSGMRALEEIRADPALRHNLGRDPLQLGPHARCSRARGQPRHPRLAHQEPLPATVGRPHDPALARDEGLTPGSGKAYVQ